mmetsp:Transcript_29623/g.65584  ORF Transcript_29623/g.65584 Transcript_29623/m.65584 type:complete len:169 (+) Transcript_29623:68-574(+)
MQCLVAKAAAVGATGRLAHRASVRSSPVANVRSPCCVVTPSRRKAFRLSIVASAAPAPGTGLSPELKKAIDEVIAKNKVVVFMKGTRAQPQCGFSARTVAVFMAMEVPFETVNILEDDRLRSGMKEYSQWPTFPQVYINGEFFGGADIVMATAQSGELKEALEAAMMS